MNLHVEISAGELLDKLTILDIKTERITDPDKLVNVRKERAMLRDIWRTAVPETVPAIAEHTQRLKAINEQLWDIEDAIRAKEAASEFDDAFIQLARAVYITNDERAAVKKAVNLALGSNLIEEKSYQPYQSDGQRTP